MSYPRWKKCDQCGNNSLREIGIDHCEKCGLPIEVYFCSICGLKVKYENCICSEKLFQKLLTE